MEEEKNGVLSEKKGVEEELETLKKEQEDLLVLLADQDTKIANYKKLLKDNNIPVSLSNRVHVHYIFGVLLYKKNQIIPKIYIKVWSVPSWKSFLYNYRKV